MKIPQVNLNSSGNIRKQPSPQDTESRSKSVSPKPSLFDENKANFKPVDNKAIASQQNQIVVNQEELTYVVNSYITEIMIAEKTTLTYSWTTIQADLLKEIQNSSQEQVLAKAAQKFIDRNLEKVKTELAQSLKDGTLTEKEVPENTKFNDEVYKKLAGELPKIFEDDFRRILLKML